MSPLLALLILAQAQGPIRNWKLERKEKNPETGQMEIMAIISGDLATIIDPTPDRAVVEVEGVTVHYFTDPKKSDPGGKPESRKVELKSARGRLDNAAGLLTLTEGVRIVELPRQESEEILKRLEAPRATILFNRRYACSKCAVEKPAAGKCPRCGGLLKVKTAPTIEADEGEYTEQGIRLAGRGLKADDGLAELTVERDAFLEMTGDPSRLRGAPPKGSGSSPDTLSRLTCEGPITLREEKPRVFVNARKNVRLFRRQGAADEIAIEGDEVDIEAIRKIDPKTRRSRAVPEQVSARGHLRVTSSQGSRASAESLGYWIEPVPPGSPLEPRETALLLGAPLVEVEQDKSRIRAPRVEIDRTGGVSTFSEGVTADLVAGKEDGGRALKLTSRRLTVKSAPGAGGPRPREVEARDQVRIEGLMEPREGQAPGHAEADRFVWDLEEERGLLEARPFVRVVQGGNLILAPLVVLEGRSIIVLKGPKRVRFSTEREGKKVELGATAEGDIVLVNAPGRSAVELGGGCSIRTEDFGLTADRMSVTLKADGSGMESLRAAGRVRARRGDGSTIYGDRLDYDPGTQEFKVTGSPTAVLVSGRTDIYPETVVVNENTKTMRLRAPRSGVVPAIIFEEPKR